MSLAISGFQKTCANPECEYMGDPEAKLEEAEELRQVFSGLDESFYVIKNFWECLHCGQLYHHRVIKRTTPEVKIGYQFKS